MQGLAQSPRVPSCVLWPTGAFSHGLAWEQHRQFWGVWAGSPGISALPGVPALVGLLCAGG